MALDSEVIELQILLENKEYLKALEKVRGKTKETGKTMKVETEKGAKGATGAFGKLKLRALAVWAAVGAAVVKAFQAIKRFVTDSVREASRFEEIQSKFDVVFKGVERTGNAALERLTGAFRLSRSSAMEFLSSFQDILVPLGMARDEAAALSGRLAEVAIDLGSFNNVDTMTVIRDIQSALTGQYETMKKYGIVLNDTILKEEARSRGLLDANGQIDRAARGTLVYEQILASSADALGDFQRTQDSAANQVKIFRENMKELKTTVGQALLPVFGNFLEKINEGLDVNRDLASVTDRLISLNSEYADVVRKLRGDVENLTEAEEAGLRVRRITLRRDIRKTKQELADMFSQYYGQRSAFRETLTGVLAQGETRIEALKKAIEISEQELNRAIEIVESGRGFEFGYDASTLDRMRDKLDEMREEYLTVTSDVDAAVQSIAESIQDGIISFEELVGLPDELVQKIETQLQNMESPTVDVSVEPAEDSDTPEDVARKFSFLDKVELHIRAGVDTETVESELRDYLDAWRERYEANMEILESGGMLNEEGVRFMNEYIAAQEKLNGILQEREQYQRAFSAWAEEQRGSLIRFAQQLGGSVGEDFIQKLNDVVRALEAGADAAENMGDLLKGDFKSVNERLQTTRELFSNISNVVSVINPEIGTLIRLMGIMNSWAAEFLRTNERINELLGDENSMQDNSTWILKDHNELLNLKTEILQAQNELIETQSVLWSQLEQKEEDFGELPGDTLKQLKEQLELLQSREPLLAGEELEANIEAQIETLRKMLALTDDEVARNKLLLEIQQLQTSEMRDQNRIIDERTRQATERLKTAIETGALDVSQLSDVGFIGQQLANVGLSGMELSAALGDLGVAGGLTRGAPTVNIGNIQTTAYGVSPDQFAENLASVIRNRITGIY